MLSLRKPYRRGYCLALKSIKSGCVVGGKPKPQIELVDCQWGVRTETGVDVVISEKTTIHGCVVMILLVIALLICFRTFILFITSA